MSSWHREEVWVVEPHEDGHEIRVFLTLSEADEYKRQLDWRADMKKGYYHRKHVDFGATGIGIPRTT